MQEQTRFNKLSHIIYLKQKAHALATYFYNSNIPGKLSPT